MSNNKTFETLTLSHPFMFGKISMDKRNSQIILSSLLNEDIILMDDPTREKFIQIKSDSKFIRMDLLNKDIQERIFDAEMQNKSKNPEINRELPKRCRYYQSLLDAEQLDSGLHYRHLNITYIIFICTFDPFGEGLYRYTFQNRCDENSELTLGDDCIKIFYNTKGDLTKAPQKTREFLEYIESQIIANKDIEALHQAVTIGNRNEEWRAEFMRQSLWEMDAHEEGRQEGITTGIATGISKGMLKTRIDLIQKKYAKNKTLEQIADELEEEIFSIQPLYNLVVENPKKTIDELLEILYTTNL